MDKYFTNLGDKAIIFFQDHFLNIIFIIAACYILRQIAYKLINAYVKSKIKPSRKHNKSDLSRRRQTIASILHSVVRVLSDILVIVLVLSEFNVSLAPFLASAGIAGAIIGFGVQSFIKDLISGSFVIAENQYRVGDWVTLAGVSGTVQGTGLRTTTLVDTDENTHYIPHGIVDVVTNHSKKYAVINIKLSLDYGTNLNDARKSIVAASKKLLKFSKYKDLIIEQPSLKLINDFGLAGLDIGIKGKVKIGYKTEISSKLRELLKDEFDENGIKLATGLMTYDSAVKLKLK